MASTGDARHHERSVTRWVIDAQAWRERQGYAGGEESTNSEIIEETFAAAGAYVMGRRMFDGGEVPWGDEPPFRAPVFVVTHRPREVLEREGDTSFTFVTDGIESAIELTPTRVVHAPDVTHVRYAVEGRAPLVLDDRGSGQPIEA